METAGKRSNRYRTARFIVASRRRLDTSSVLWYCYNMKNGGRFKKGERNSPETEFKKGQHWRQPQLFRDKDWLFNEYVNNQKSARDIASEFSVHENAILFWLKKHVIPRRSLSETRSIKHWGLSGEKNAMFGKRGEGTPNWKGGHTPERASCYSSIEWADASKSVWKRDFGQCQRCKIKANDGANLHIHHIVSFSVKELRTVLDNLVLLCIDCHHFIHSKANVEKEFIKKGDRNGIE